MPAIDAAASTPHSTTAIRMLALSGDLFPAMAEIYTTDSHQVQPRIGGRTLQPTTEREILDYLNRITHAAEAINRHLIALGERIELVAETGRNSGDSDGKVRPK